MESRINGVNGNEHSPCNGFDTQSPVKRKRVSTKIFCDPIHGQIALHPACVAIIDTPQFQRLRHLKQTSFVEYVYPGATHNRFSHSLGVCYLARKFLQELRERQPELKISDIDVLCVQLAGLCHDLGHGPYSHTWERFMELSNLHKGVKKKWRHEIVSVNMLDYLIEENNLTPVLKNFGIGSEEIQLIKDYISGIQPTDGSRTFLYQIVNNDVSGLDVDKWDYFLRDCHYLGLACNFEYERLMQFAKVFDVGGKAQICFRDKLLESVYNVFRTRSNLHRLAYQHKIVRITEEMFLDAFLMSDGKITGLNGEILQFWEWSMSAAFDQEEKLCVALGHYCMLTDDLVYTCLKNTIKPNLQKVSALVKAVERRSCENSGFYQYIGLKILSHMYDETEILNGLCKFLPLANEIMLDWHENNADSDDFHEKNYEPVTSNDICVCVISVNWGKGAENPVNFVHFYCKDQACTSSSLDHLEVSAILPKVFEEIQVQVLCRRSDQFAFKVTRWCYDQFWQASPCRNCSQL